MKKILVVAMVDSIHTARWLRQFDQDDYEFVVFPSSPNRRIHPLIRSHKGSGSRSIIRIPRPMTLGALPLGIIDLFANNFFRAKLLARVIKSVQPDLIHIMETQHAGYLTSKALATVENRPRVVLSIWGSDLFWFTRFKAHQARITSVLEISDVLVTECHRDEQLARDNGFQGECVYGIPASGGFDHREFGRAIEIRPPSTRNVIAVKGYSGFVGLGPSVLRVLNSISDELRGFKIVVYSASVYTKLFAYFLRLPSNVDFKIHLKHTRTPDQMRELFGESRAVIALSKSDGLPATIKEAAFTGPFPIQTDTSCAGEWFKDGVSVLLVPPDSPDALRDAIVRVLNDDQLVDSAAKFNFEVARTRMDNLVVRKKIETIYV